MDCKQADNLMIDFLYGELSTGDRAAFEKHLQGCPEHAREIEKLRGVLNLVRAQEPEEVPEAVSARIMANARARMPQRAKPAPFLSLIWNPVAAAAVLAVVVVTVGLATYFTSEPGLDEEPALEATKPLAVAEKPQPMPGIAAKEEEKKEYAAAPEPKVPVEAPAAEPAPPPIPTERVLKKPKRRKARKSPGKKKGYKSIPKTPEVWGSRAKAKSATPTGVRGGAAGPGDSYYPPKATSTVGKADRSMEGATGAERKRMEREKKAKDKKKVSRPAEERDFAKPPPPMKAAPPPTAPPPREEMMEAESVAMSVDSADMEDDSYPQAAPRAKKAEKREPTDYYKAAEADLVNKRYDAAVSKYRTFLAQKPSDPRAPTCRYRIAKALFLAGRCSEAIKAVEAAVSGSPRHPMAPNALLDQGSCYERLNRFSEANATYRRINRDYPSYTEEAQKGMRRTRPPDADVKPAATEQHR
jgi:TolA-binding protein